MPKTVKITARALTFFYDLFWVSVDLHFNNFGLPKENGL